LSRLFSMDAGKEIALDLRDVMLVDRSAIEFLIYCEAEKISLQNCPAYIRHWMNAGERATPKSGELPTSLLEEREGCDGFQRSSFAGNGWERVIAE